MNELMNECMNVMIYFLLVPHVHRNPDELKDTPERDLTCKMGDLNRHSGQKILSIHKNSLFFILIAVFLDGYCVQQLHMHKSNHFQIGQKLRNLRSPRKKSNNQRGRLLRPYSLEVMATWMLRIAWVFD